MTDYERIAGHPALDFLNTLGGDRHSETTEHLRSFDDLASWGQMLGLVSRPLSLKLIKQAENNIASANEVLKRARNLREGLYRILAAFHEKKALPEKDLLLLCKETESAIRHAKIALKKNQFIWEWPDSDENLARVLWPISKMASDLLMSFDLDRVRECASARCTWMFLDTSKNHSRRWCRMEDCGNREKARRFREN